MKKAKKIPNSHDIMIETGKDRIENQTEKKTRCEDVRITANFVECNAIKIERIVGDIISISENLQKQKKIRQRKRIYLRISYWKI